MKLVIRLAKKDDSSELLNLICEIHGNEIRELASDYIQSMFSNFFRKPEFIIALDGDKIIGAASYTEELFTINVWGIGWVGVKKAYRNQHVGEKIIQKCLEDISNKIAEPVTVILRTHPAQTGLYDKVGFKILGNDHEGGSFMTLTLKPSVNSVSSVVKKFKPSLPEFRMNSKVIQKLWIPL